MLVKIAEVAQDFYLFLAHYLSVIFDSISYYLSGDFVALIVGTLCAAFAGAYGAQFIAIRNSRWQDDLRELRKINAASSMSLDITNALLNIKEQHTLTIIETFREQKRIFEESRSTERLKGEKGQPIAFHFDFRNISTPLMPDQILMRMIYEELNSNIKINTIILDLCRAISNLRSTIETRKTAIIKIAHTPDVEKSLFIYFGTKDDKGNFDSTYSDSIDGIESYLDDSIFFGIKLSEELNKYGKCKKKSFGKRAPDIIGADYTDPKQKGLIPDSSLYRRWERKFEKID